MVQTEDEVRGFGNFAGDVVIVEHDDGVRAIYAHLAHHGVEVQVGDAVRVGDLLGRSGMTGRTLYPHLHVHLERDGAPVALGFVGIGAPRFGVSYRAPL